MKYGLYRIEGQFKGGIYTMSITLQWLMNSGGGGYHIYIDSHGCENRTL